MKSIIQEDREHCFICGGRANGDPLDEHHVYGGANRTISERYGLKVYLHHNKCHIFGKQSVHQNAEVGKMVKQVVQERAMQYYNWTVDDFMRLIGKSYL